MLDCPHTDRRRLKVLVGGTLFVMCPECADGWQDDVGEPPEWWDPPAPDELALAEELRHLKLARLYMEHVDEEYWAARQLVADETRRIHDEYGISLRELSRELKMTPAAMALFCRWERGEGYTYEPRESKRQEEYKKRLAELSYLRRKTRAVRKANTGVLPSTHAVKEQPPDGSAHGAVQPERPKPARTTRRR